MYVIILPGNTPRADQFAKYLARQGHLVTIDPHSENTYMDGVQVIKSFDDQATISELWADFEEEENTATFTMQARTGKLEHQYSWSKDRGFDCGVTRVEPMNRVQETNTFELRRFAASLIEFCNLVEGSK